MTLDKINTIDRYINALSGVYVRKDSPLLTEEDRKILNDLISNDLYAENCRRSGGMWERFHDLGTELESVRSWENTLINRVDQRIDELVKRRKRLSEA